MRTRSTVAALPALLAAMLLSTTAHAQGIVIPGAGPINRSMAGTAVAAPLDAAGAILTNPATMSDLPNSEVVIGFEFLYLSQHVETSIGGGPAASTRSDSGLSGLPTLAIAWQPEDSPWTFGLGLFTVGGFGVNYPQDPNNLILGTGPQYSRLQVLQIVPSVALKLTDRLSIGIAPTLTIADASLDVPGSPVAGLTHGKMNWGGGFQGGLYYVTDSCWHFGLSYKSPQWFDDFEFNTATGPATLPFTYPGIYSAGAAYSGFERLMLAMDVRYVDYGNANFLGEQPPFNGLGWESVWAVSMGAQYQLTESLAIRGGYFYTQNPIPDEYSAFNVSAAAIYQNIVSMGLTWQMTCKTSLSLSYLHAFENTGTGLIGPLEVTNRESIDAFVAGLEIKF